LALLAAGGLMAGTVTGWIARTNFYQYLPTPWVIRAAGRGSVDAFAILEQRVNFDQVKGERMQDVIETGLSVQGAEKTNATTQKWIDLLAQIEKYVGMSAAQRERFCSQMVRLEAHARPRAR